MKKVRINFTLDQRKEINKVIKGERDWILIPSPKILGEDSFNSIIGIENNEKYICVYNKNHKKYLELDTIIGKHIVEFEGKEILEKDREEDHY